MGQVALERVELSEQGLGRHAPFTTHASGYERAASEAAAGQPRAQPHDLLLEDLEAGLAYR
jgi:hypothetical protein